MKRGWIGLVLLLVMLAGGLLVTHHMAGSHREISGELEQAALHALASNWEEAREDAENAYEDWQEHWHFTAAFADHEPMEQIDALFSQLDAYRIARDKVSFAAVCKELSRQVEAIGDAHGLTWWNLL